MTGRALAGSGQPRVLGPIRGALGHPFTAVVALFVLSRLFVIAVGLLTATLAGEPGSVGSVLCRFDCSWYVQIAEDGYTTAGHALRPGSTRYAFFPLLPMLVAGFRAVTGLDVVNAGLLVSNALFIAALWLVYVYGHDIGLNQRAGLLAVAMLCFVPQSFVFSSVYTESLFLLLLAAGMLSMRRGHYLRSGIAGALLSATRANGILFVVYPLARIVRTRGMRAFFSPWREPQAFLPIFLAPLGLFAFWTFSFVTTGDAFAHSSSARWGWGWRFAAPWENLVFFALADERAIFWLAGSVLMFAASLLLVVQRRYEEFVLCLAMFLLFWSGTVPNSLLRYGIVLFPIWLGLADALENRPRWWAYGLIAAMAIVNGLLMVGWTLNDLIAI